MILDEINKELEKGKSEIMVRGPIVTYPTFQVWGDMKIVSFTGQPISPATCIDENVEVRFNVCASGAAFGPPYPRVYSIDNCHKEEGLHEHEGESVSKIETKTIGEVLLRFFSKALGI